MFTQEDFDSKERFEAVTKKYVQNAIFVNLNWFDYKKAVGLNPALPFNLQPFKSADLKMLIG